MAATDVVTLERAKKALSEGAGDTRKQDLVAQVVTAASQYLDQACGPIVQRQVVGETHDGFGASVRLHLQPVVSVQSLTEYVSGSGTTLTGRTALTDGTYQLRSWPVGDPAGLYSGKIARTELGWSQRCSYFRGPVVASYTAGRYATTELAQESRFGQACLTLVRWMWQAELTGVQIDADGASSVSIFPRAVPMSVRQLLSEDWMSGVVVA